MSSVSRLTKQRRYGQFGSTPSIGARWLPSFGNAPAPVTQADVIWTLDKNNAVWSLDVRNAVWGLDLNVPVWRIDVRSN
jgi:hypothetical protein